MLALEGQFRGDVYVMNRSLRGLGCRNRVYRELRQRGESGVIRESTRTGHRDIDLDVAIEIGL
jgi:hypothetical protein